MFWAVVARWTKVSATDSSSPEPAAVGSPAWCNSWRGGMSWSRTKGRTFYPAKHVEDAWKCWKNSYIMLYMWLYVLSCVDMCVYSISRLSCSKAILDPAGWWGRGPLGALPALDLYQRMDLERFQLSGNTSTYLNISRHTVYIIIYIYALIYIYDYIYNHIYISGLWTWESQGVLGQISVRTCHWWTSQQSWTIRNCPSRQSTSAPLLSSHRCPARQGTFFRSYMGWEIPELL